MSNKVRPMPQMPREVKISRGSWKKSLKIFIIVALVVGLGIGAWVAFSANRALKKITTDGNNKSSLLSLLDLNSGSVKGQSEGRTNILLLGMGGSNHPGGSLSDTMIMVSIDHKNKQLGMMSVPRDLWVPIPGDGHAKINEAYAKGESNTKIAGSGGALSSKTIENVLGVPIHYYIRLDFEGFKKVIDTIGGVDIYVEKDLSDPYYPADNMIDYSPFKITTGQHHMDGNMALKYARSRETTSDFDRSRRQQQVMLAVKEKILTLNILANPKKVTDLINILGDHIRTNIQVDELYSLWNISKNIDTTNMVNKVLDTAADGPLTSSQDYRGYYIYPKAGIDNFEALKLMAKNLFNQNTTDAAASVKIQILNGTDQSGVAKTVSEYLSGYGYRSLKIGDAPSKTTKTVVNDYSGGKYNAIAQEIATQLNASVDTKAETLKNFDIQVVVGQDYLR